MTKTLEVEGFSGCWPRYMDDGVSGCGFFFIVKDTIFSKHAF